MDNFDESNQSPVSSMSILIDQAKNGVFYGIGLTITSLIFGLSDGNGIFFIIGWLFVGFITVTVGLSWPNTFISTLLIVPSLSLYGESGNRMERFWLDLASVAGLIINTLLLLACYQLISEFGGVGLPSFEPFGVRFFYNFSY